MNKRPIRTSRERGSGLIVIIMIVAFMLAVGMLLLTVTGTSPKASDSMRLQGMAYVAPDPTNSIFNTEILVTDPRCAYTVFLINDEAPGTITADDGDCILVCIG